MEAALVRSAAPTLHEAGVADFESATYWAMMAPAGVPQPILDRV